MKNIKELTDYLDKFKKELTTLNDSILWFSKYEKFREIIMKYKDDEAVKSLMDSFMNNYKSDFDSYYEFFKGCEEKYIVASEKAITDKFLKSGNKVINALNLGNEAIDKTSEHVVAEKEMMKRITPEAKTLIMVGSGPFPESTIIYGKGGFESIVGIDKDEKAIIKAKQVIGNLGLENIHFINIEAKEYDDYSGDIIIIGNFVKPKYEVLVKVVEKMKDKAFIFLRIPSSLDQLCSEPIFEHQVQKLGLNIVKKLKKTFDIGDTTWILSKKG
jgi:16S rRNA G527 N7-methylase RsmG